jgi:Circularly permutated YpsA SLOG family
MEEAIPKIISGGQTGADRAALDWALSRKLPCGGWCPKGRKAEDGTIPEIYPLRESTSTSYLQRTEWNVRDSDGTVVFSLAPKLTGGSLKTVEFARKHNKPWIHVSAVDPDPAGRLQRFLEVNVIDTLNIAGPRKQRRRTRSPEDKKPRPARCSDSSASSTPGGSWSA